MTPLIIALIEINTSQNIVLMKEIRKYHKTNTQKHNHKTSRFLVATSSLFIATALATDHFIVIQFES
jgi:hypothetical protein